jgi:hypothetical protein
MTAAAAFLEVLESEREAALRADVDALAAVQERKREALSALLGSDASEDLIAELRARAQANLRLIRHLVGCLQGLVSPQAPTYTAAGDRPSGGLSRSWGRL